MRIQVNAQRGTAVSLLQKGSKDSRYFNVYAKIRWM